MAATAWCAEVNAAVHSQIATVPDERLVVARDVLRVLPSSRPTMRLGLSRKVDKLSAVRIGSARYSVPHLLRGLGSCHCRLRPGMTVRVACTKH